MAPSSLNTFSHRSLGLTKYVSAIEIFTAPLGCHHLPSFSLRLGTRKPSGPELNSTTKSEKSDRQVQTNKGNLNRQTPARKRRSKRHCIIEERLSRLPPRRRTMERFPPFPSEETSLFFGQHRDLPQEPSASSASPAQSPTNQTVRLFPRKKKGSASSNARELVVDKDTIKLYVHLPQADAAHKLGISLSALKSVCRRIGLARWPYKRQYTIMAPSSDTEVMDFSLFEEALKHVEGQLSRQKGKVSRRSSLPDFLSTKTYEIHSL
eukprot:760297-Hanusia_phi.AAC.1